MSNSKTILRSALFLCLFFYCFESGNSFKYRKGWKDGTGTVDEEFKGWPIAQQKLGTDEARLILIREYFNREGVGVEIGVEVGSFSEMILKNAFPKTLYMIDPWVHHNEEDGPFSKALLNAKQPVQDNRYRTALKNVWPYVQTGKAVVLRDFSHNVVQLFKDRSLDFVYIDACHWYACTSQDIKDWAPKVKPSGLLCGHDYDPSRFEGGVFRAVNEFVAAGHAEKYLLLNNNWCLKLL